ncbi:MAG: TIGR00282 family metallophosphoesterase [Armatimonadota bacterium]|nr:MAG: TIGR00282 family metallophosphoesterase [Armatimonadota bacterium]
MNILFIGDIVGRPGRRALQRALPELVERWQPDFVIANGENAAAGFGITASVAEEILAPGVDVITTGNHVWNKKEAEQFLAQESRVLRPANYPPEAPGRGAGVFESRSGVPVAVINLCGRVFMECLDCPFREVERQIAELGEAARAIVVDMHGEATSEKLAMGWMVDGRVSAVIGTHTHVQTADAQVMPGGTAYITDVGMVGPRDSVLGIEPSTVIERFTRQMPKKFELARGPVVIGAAVIEIDEETGRARSIKTLQEVEPDPLVESAAEGQN